MGSNVTPITPGAMTRQRETTPGPAKYGYPETDIVRACKRSGLDLATTLLVIDRLRDPHAPELKTPNAECYEPPKTKRPYNHQLAKEIGRVCGKDVEFAFINIYARGEIHTNKRRNLVNCFQFDRTPQGLEYWRSINQQLRTARGHD